MMSNGDKSSSYICIHKEQYSNCLSGKREPSRNDYMDLVSKWRSPAADPDGVILQSHLPTCLVSPGHLFWHVWHYI